METTAARKPARTPRVRARTAALLENVELPHRLEDTTLVRAKDLQHCRFERLKVHVSYDSGLDQWVAKVSSALVIWTGPTRDKLLKPLKAHLRALWKDNGIPSQLFLQDRTTGQWSEAAEATYGYDPRSSRG